VRDLSTFETEAAENALGGEKEAGDGLKTRKNARSVTNSLARSTGKRRLTRPSVARWGEKQDLIHGPRTADVAGDLASGSSDGPRNGRADQICGWQGGIARLIPVARYGKVGDE